MCTPVTSGGGFKMLGEMIQEGKRVRDESYTNAFMSPRGDAGIQKQAQQPTPSRFQIGTLSNPMGNAMVGMAIAKQNPSAFANGPIKVNTSNQQTGRVIS